MSKIRSLLYFDRKKTLEMISFLNNSANDTYINRIMFNPLLLLHRLLPLRMKFLPESFVLQENREIKALITIAPVRTGIKKAEIQKLCFEENSFDIASELVQYVVSMYKAMGAFSVMVKVDDYQTDLLDMFINKCGFSRISSEKLWRVNDFVHCDYDPKMFRRLRNSDAKAVSELYYETLLPHFRPLLGRSWKEFSENVFSGLSCCSEFSYVKETDGKVSCCIIIKTSDNENFTADIIRSGWDNTEINAILNFISDTIKKRKKRFGLFVKSKQYMNNSAELESAYGQNGFSAVQSKLVLTNSSASVLREPSTSGKYTVLTDFFPTNAIST